MPSRAIKNARKTGKSAERNAAKPTVAGPNLYDGRANPKANPQRVSPTPPSGRGQKTIDWNS